MSESDYVHTYVIRFQIRVVFLNSVIKNRNYHTLSSISSLPGRDNVHIETNSAILQQRKTNLMCNTALLRWVVNFSVGFNEVYMFSLDLLYPLVLL
jgi:hypothetical protein